jgi:hypothetical protein
MPDPRVRSDIPDGGRVLSASFAFVNGHVVTSYSWMTIHDTPGEWPRASR